MVDRPEVDKNQGDREESTAGDDPACYVYNPTEGPTFSIGHMLVTLKATGAQTGGRFGLVEVTIPPYFAEIVPHLHHSTSKAIYLTQGMLAVTLGEETMVLRQGSFIMVQPMQPHRFWNPAATQATFLVYFTPAGAEEFFEALAQSALVVEAELPGAVAKIWALGMSHDHHPADVSR
jgi:quercetin dioxygenase-like cupin family protein